MEGTARTPSQGKAAKFLGIDSQQRLEATFTELLQVAPDGGGVSPTSLTDLYVDMPLLGVHTLIASQSFL